MSTEDNRRFRAHLGTCRRCQEAFQVGLLVEAVARRPERLLQIVRDYGKPAAAAVIVAFGLGAWLALGLTPIGMQGTVTTTMAWIEGPFAEGPRPHVSSTALGGEIAGEGSAYDDERQRNGWLFGQNKSMAAAASALHHRNYAQAEEALQALEASATGNAGLLAKVYNDRAVLNLELAERLPTDSCEVVARVQGAEAEQEGACDEKMRLLREALASLERSLEWTPGRPAALFNRGLVLDALGLNLSAAAAFRAAAAVAPPAWAKVATEQADKLTKGGQQDRYFTQQTEQVLREFADAVNAAQEGNAAATSRATIAVRGAADYVAQLRNDGRDDEVVRNKMYELARTGTVSQRRLLVPLAEALDGAGSDMAKRLALYPPASSPNRARLLAGAASYLKIPDNRRVSLLVELVKEGDVELVMGLLGTNPAYYGRQEVAVPSGFLERVKQLEKEPYLAVRAGAIEVRLALAKQESERAIQKLKEMAKSCPDSHGDRCEDLELRLVYAYVTHERWSEAATRAQRGLALANRSPSTLTRPLMLRLMADIASAQNAPWLALAYVEEIRLAVVPGADGTVAPALCAVLGDALERKAAVHLFHLLDIKGTLQTLEQAMQPLKECTKTPLAVTGLDLLAALTTAGEAPPEWQQRLVEGAAPLEQGKRVDLSAFIAASAARVRSRAAGTAALTALTRGVEEPKEEGRQVQLERQKVLSYVYRDLALDAGDAAAAGDPGGYARAFDMVAKQLRIPAPPQMCALALVSNLGRTVVVAKDERGSVLGSTAKNQWRWVDRRGAQLVPPNVQDALRGCRSVRVLASPGIFGLSRLLQEVPWSYAVAAKPVPATGGPRGPSVVVANIDPPAKLQLPRPALIRVDDRGPGTIALVGSRATLSRVIEALKTAVEIEFYGHGMQKPNDAEGSYLVLASDPEQQDEFRFSGRDIPVLAGAPDIYLKACVTADAGFQNSEARSLASAFVERGARSTFAATVSIPDRGANLFFNRIRELRRQGQSPAEALAGARASFKKDGQFQPWMDDVVCLEPA